MKIAFILAFLTAAFAFHMPLHMIDPVQLLANPNHPFINSILHRLFPSLTPSQQTLLINAIVAAIHVAFPDLPLSKYPEDNNSAPPPIQAAINSVLSSLTAAQQSALLGALINAITGSALAVHQQAKQEALLQDNLNITLTFLLYSIWPTLSSTQQINMLNSLISQSTAQ